MSPRRVRWRLAAAVAAAAVAIPASFAAATTAQVAASPSKSRARSAAFTDPAGVLAGAPIHGVVYQDSYVTPTVLLADLQRLKTDGVNTISIYIMTYVDSAPHPTSVKMTVRTPSDTELGLLADTAHNVGLAVEFHPLIWSTGKYVWRGNFEPVPSELAPFFASYTKMIDHYADLAQEHGVEVFSVGSELALLQRHSRLWRNLVADVRGRYQGIVTYMSNKPAWYTMSWWNALDVIAVSPYYGLTNKDNAPVDEMVAAWKVNLPLVKWLYNKWHKPVLFDELGFESMLGSEVSPATAHRDQSALPSEQVQQRAYEATYQATQGLPWIRGMVWFNWSPVMTAPAPIDKTYNPRDKSAECVMAKYWAPSLPAAISALGKVGAACVAAHIL